jgi:hypothetical protein
MAMGLINPKKWMVSEFQSLKIPPNLHGFGGGLPLFHVIVHHVFMK